MGHFFVNIMDKQDPSSETSINQVKLDTIAPEFDSVELVKQKGNNLRSNIDTFTGSAIAVLVFATLALVTFLHMMGNEEIVDRLMEDKSIPTLEKVETASKIRKENYSNLYNILGPLIGAVAGYYFATKVNEKKE